MRNRYYIKDIGISRLDLQSATLFISEAIEKNRLGYICVTNSRTAYIANHDSGYCKIQNDSLLTVPDGAPLFWIARNRGYKEVGKISGVDLMSSLFSISNENGFSHYFFGSTIETINKLENKLNLEFPGIQIKGAVSPPFQPLEKFDIDTLALELNILKPTFFWCGLGAPKQEMFIAALQPKLNSTICIGVGLAFEYLSGSVKRAPVWMQKAGFEWSFRILQQPHNIKRFFLPFTWILGQLFISIFRKKLDG